MPRSLLIVDDEIDMLELLKRSLKPDLDCRVATASTGQQALDRLTQQSFDLILADIKMPGMDGLELLERIKMNHPDQTVVMMTAFGSVDIAVKAVRNGAYDFITKPFDHDALVVRLEKALERTRLMRENFRLQRECRENDMFQNMVGKSAVMNRVYETIQTVAQTDLTVLITGESGTGKELAARAVHNLSTRRRQPFVAVNCPTVPENILESELFGYKKGAFTHAAQNRIGLFQEAHRGSIFLDEIGDISPTIQTKLLRVLQEKEIKPLGDTKSIKVDARIIASTNQNLEDKIKRGEFREDFYYRLNVLPIQLPPLRDHREDIPIMASYLLEKHCALLNKPLKKLSPELMDRLMSHQWEGNVRELENVIMQGISFSRSDDIHVRDVSLGTSAPTEHGPNARAHAHLPYKEAKEKNLTAFNHQYISRLLRSTQGNVSQAARQCGLERQALQQIMRRYGIKADLFRKP
jgi:DNA-binding NtrC family response regulator